MWTGQKVFINLITSFLSRILDKLDIKLITNTFVIGIPISSKDPDSICFFPEGCGYFSKEFEEIFPIANTNYETDPRKNLRCFGAAQYINEPLQASLYPDALIKAFNSILNEHHSKTRLVSFCSKPVEVNCHWVITVIQIGKNEWDKQYRLPEKHFEYNGDRKHRTYYRSFLEAIIHEILSVGVDRLQSPSQGSTWEFPKLERILEDAASNLLSSMKTDVTRIMSGNLLELANAISAERYEGLGSKGKLIICQKDSKYISIKIKLRNPIHTDNYRGIRKLIEMSSKTMALLCDGIEVWGLGSILDSYDPLSEDLFEIIFTDHYSWELIHNYKEVMLSVKYRQPKLPIKRFDESLLIDHIIRFFNISEKETLDVLKDAVNAAVEQQHGTMLVITSKAEAETEAIRLSAQSTVIEPVLASKDVISHVSSIDGAILMSPDGMIHSFGVILDGVANGNGDPSRGARFNSAIRYVDGKKVSNINCLALIVSEDGYVNLYPQLQPRVDRSILDRLLENIEGLVDISQQFDYEKAQSLIWSLHNLRFYLLKKDIERINAVKDVISTHMNRFSYRDMSQTGIIFITPNLNDFNINDEMNDGYYL